METVEQQVKINPLIEKNRAAIPGVVFRLPSRGKIYDKGVLADNVEEGEVVVYSMRLKEELKMKSVDSILQGTAVSESIRYCVPEVLDPLKLCPEDVDYLITAIKKMTHGSLFKYKDRCMNLNDKSSQKTPDNALNEMTEASRTDNIELPEQQNSSKEEETGSGGNINNMGENSDTCEFNVSLDFFLNNAKELNVEEYQENNTMMLNTFNIEFHPITFKDFKELNTLNLQDQEGMTDDEYFNFVTEFSNTNISKRIKKVDEIDDPTTIREWVETLSLIDREKIFNKVSELQDWGIDFKYTIKCEKCGKSKQTDQTYINPLYFFLTY